MHIAKLYPVVSTCPWTEKKTKLAKIAAIHGMIQKFVAHAQIREI